MTATKASGTRPAEILRQLWIALPAPIATEIGAVVALITASVPGIIAALVSVGVLASAMPYLRPPDALTRAAILIAGPPLRYAVLLVAVGKTWLTPGEGVAPALLLLLVLAFLVPLAGFLIAQARLARR
jgi:hypothetical protein